MAQPLYLRSMPDARAQHKHSAPSQSPVKGTQCLRCGVLVSLELSCQRPCPGIAFSESPPVRSCHFVQTLGHSLYCSLGKPALSYDCSGRLITAKPVFCR